MNQFQSIDCSNLLILSLLPTFMCSYFIQSFSSSIICRCTASTNNCRKYSDLFHNNLVYFCDNYWRCAPISINMVVGCTAHWSFSNLPIYVHINLIQWSDSRTSWRNTRFKLQYLLKIIRGRSLFRRILDFVTS